MASRALGLEPSTKTFAASTGSLTFGASTTSISQPRLRHYREFLTPALHRRFTRAAGVVFLACYVEAILLGEKKSWFWLWFPIGPVGLRVLLLFISCLVVFVLRVAQLRFADRTATSQLSTFWQYYVSINTLQTLAFYLFSAWWFSEVYVWSASENADLNWVVEGKSYERPSLNERPIYLRAHFFTLAIMQSVKYMYSGSDKVPLPIPKASGIIGQRVAEKGPFERLQAKLFPLLHYSVSMAFILSISSLLSYPLLVRRYAWSWSLWFARLVWSIPRSSQPPTMPPYHWTVLVRSFTSGILLLLLWEISVAAFTEYVAQVPIKNGKPLTDDSRDPNGSLLNGLNSKREAVRIFAFWELFYISSEVEARRKLLYSDIDRVGGSTWSQVLKSSLTVVEGVATRLIDTHTPPPELIVVEKKEKKLQTLPRLSAPLRDDPVFAHSPEPANTREFVENKIASIAKSYGLSPVKPGSDASPVHRYLGMARDKLLTQDQKDTVSPESLAATAKWAVLRILTSGVGGIFRQTFARRVKVKALGTPQSNLVQILFAIDSITFLALAGLEEDSFGTVYKDLALILRTFANLVKTVKAFLKESSPHWTDVKFGEADRHVAEVELIVDHLQTALRNLIEKYAKYAKDIGLEEGEIRAAKKAAGMIEA